MAVRSRFRYFSWIYLELVCVFFKITWKIFSRIHAEFPKSKILNIIVILFLHTIIDGKAMAYNLFTGTDCMAECSCQLGIVFVVDFDVGQIPDWCLHTHTHIHTHYPVLWPLWLTSSVGRTENNRWDIGRVYGGIKFIGKFIKPGAYSYVYIITIINNIFINV